MKADALYLVAHQLIKAQIYDNSGPEACIGGSLTIILFRLLDLINIATTIVVHDGLASPFPSLLLSCPPHKLECVQPCCFRRPFLGRFRLRLC